MLVYFERGGLENSEVAHLVHHIARETLYIIYIMVHIHVVCICFKMSKCSFNFLTTADSCDLIVDTLSMQLGQNTYIL